ncbi:MAG: hypothetical protein IJY94_06885 [Clostridia bacterium]|nr:hypothetical protein [Clostridia bacterium]
MKRIIAIIMTLTLALCLFSCDSGSSSNGGKDTYTGELNDAKTTLVIDNNTATFSMSEEREFKEQNTTVLQSATQTGIIESNKDGVLTIVFNKPGAAATMSMKFSGSGASAYKKTLKQQFSSMNDSAYKDAMLTTLDGKTLKMSIGDKYWEEVGPGSSQVIVVKLDTANKTFTQMDSGIG